MEGTGAVTVVRPRPHASKRELAALGVGLLVVGVLGDLLELLAFVFVPVSRIPAVRRWLERDDAAPDQLEVRADAVTSVGPRGGRAIRRVDRAVLTVRDMEGTPTLYVAGTADRDATIDVGAYDLDDVGRAVLAHGWPWQPPGSAVTYPPTGRPDSDESPAFEVVLREGWTRPAPSKAIVALVLVGTFGALVTHFALAFAGVPTRALYFVVPAFAVAMAAVVVVIALVWHRMSRLSFAVDERRVVVRYGVVAKLVVVRKAVVEARAGRRWVRLKEDGRWRHTWLPIAPRRRELVAALCSYGWPVVDET